MDPEKAQRQAREFEEAQRIARDTGRDPGEVLKEEFGWDPWPLLTAQAYLHAMKPIDLERTPPTPEAVDLLPAEIAHRYGALPVCRMGAQLIVAVAEAATAASVCVQLEAVCGMPVQAVLASQETWVAAMDRCYPRSD